MYSYPSTIVKVLLGESKSLNPIDHLDILSINWLDLSVMVKNNLIITLSNEVLDFPDNNIYQLKVQKKEQLDELISILNLQYKPASQSLDNHYTAYGQYVKLISNGITIHLDIIPLKEKLNSNTIFWN
jgi:hypothetical protein